MYEKHGLSGTKIYRVWASMIQRCINPKIKGYKNYGGRGIKVCERWRDFVNFHEDMGNPPPNYTLDRIDNDGNYEPENCKWSTFKDQARNRRSNVLPSKRKLGGYTANKTISKCQCGNETRNKDGVCVICKLNERHGVNQQLGTGRTL